MTEANGQGPPEQRIAVVGMAGRFPGAPDLDAFWQLLAEGREGLTRFDDRDLADAGTGADPALVPVSGALERPADFDAEFFGFTPAEAEVTDPQHRLFLECAWEALENAGYSGPNGKSRVGLFAGASHTAYRADRVTPHPRAAELWHPVQVSMGNDIDAIPLRVSYKLGLTGPSILVQTACSSALVAVHLACQSLLLGESNLAIAGGASVRLLEPSGYRCQEGGILSPDGHCRPFDAAARGTVPGDGVGVVVLKRLDDAERDGGCVRALILGSAVNNDGSAKLGFTAPSADGQTSVILDALAVSGIDPETIDYIEGHGTATPLGDPVEVRALAEAFAARPSRPGERGGRTVPCLLGSVKSNIGHLDAAAGIAGLIKAVLALEHGFIPPTLHYARPNPEAGLEDSCFLVNAEGTPWPDLGHPRRAGVSSFGFGGTNAHIVLEAAPGQARDRIGTPAGPQVLPLSARTRTALARASRQLADHLAEHPDIQVADAAFTLQAGREHMPVRRAVVAGPDLADVVVALRTRSEAAHGSDPNPFVTFLLPGQGSQYAGMGAQLYGRQPVFRAALDECAELFAPHLGTDLRKVLFSDDDDAEARLALTRNTQPAVFAVEIALARLLESWGVRPAAMVGHSLGELTAGCLASVLTTEDAVMVVAARATLLQEAPRGSMMAVPLAEGSLRDLIADLLSDQQDGCVAIAAVNAPTSSVIAGDDAGVTRVCARLEEHGIACRPLGTSHAFHTALLDQALPAFADVMRGVRLARPQIPFLSNATGTWITDKQATDPDYWVRQIRRPVSFSSCLATLLGDAAEPAPRLDVTGKPVLLEVGPGTALTGFARLHRSGTTQPTAISMLCRPPSGQLSGTALAEADAEERSVLGAVASLWEHGVTIDWAALRHGAACRRVPLPGYSFDRRTYLLPRHVTESRREQAYAVAGDLPATGDGQPADTPERIAGPGRPEDETGSACDLTAAVTGVWREVLGIDVIDSQEDFYEIGGNSLYAIQIMGRLRTIDPGLPMSTIFTAPTITSLAEAIRERRATGAATLAEDGLDEAGLESLLDEIEGLSPDEVEVFLKEGGDE